MPTKTTVRRTNIEFPEAYPTGFYGPSSPFMHVDFADSFMSLTRMGRYNPFLDWLGFRPTVRDRRSIKIITWVSNQGASEGKPIPSLMPERDCGYGAGVEEGRTTYEVKGFKEFKSHSNTRSITEEIKESPEEERIRLDGEEIIDNEEWDLLKCNTVITADLHRWIIQELQNVTNYDYVDVYGNSPTIMYGNTVNMAGNSLHPVDESGKSVGSKNVTYNGNAVKDGYVFMDLLNSAVIEMQTRMGLSPQLSGNDLDEESLVLLVPTIAVAPVFDAYTCRFTCNNNVHRMDETSVRQERNALFGQGLFRQGAITVNGTKISIVPYEYNLINSDGSADFYLLANNIGGNTVSDEEDSDSIGHKLIYVDYLYMLGAEQRGRGKYISSDGGKFLSWTEDKNKCFIQVQSMEARMVCPAKWAMWRFANIGINNVFGVTSGDPLSEHFYEQHMVAYQGG